MGVEKQADPHNTAFRHLEPNNTWTAEDPGSTVESSRERQPVRRRAASTLSPLSRRQLAGDAGSAIQASPNLACLRNCHGDISLVAPARAIGATRSLERWCRLTTFKSGDLVRHKSKPEWGIGRVTGQTVEGKVLVEFSPRAGDVLLTAAGAEQHLVVDTGAAWQAAPPRCAAPPPSVAFRAPRAPWTFCGRSPGATGTWRACPQCSAQNGKQHVLRPYPAAFDLPAPAGLRHPTPSPADAGAPALCVSCRTNGEGRGGRLACLRRVRKIGQAPRESRHPRYSGIARQCPLAKQSPTVERYKDSRPTLFPGPP